ncbi:unnamed protein product [Phyllotreta striolata]|uniref:Uncharacterized protein n=1 Tax=Phyllotreta striolata TaxID=444603 RepID=A0A9N9TJ24_PHYSR|nr:unnamed protein product [Phyllotreta striolata]
MYLRKSPTTIPFTMNQKVDPKQQCMGHTCVTTKCNPGQCQCQGCGTCTKCKQNIEETEVSEDGPPPVYSKKPNCGKERCRCCPKCPSGRDNITLRDKMSKDKDRDRDRDRERARPHVEKQ